MSTVKISELALITQLNANTSNTLFLAVDLPTGVTGKFTGHTLAQGLYSHEVLNVGNNAVTLPNTVAQFALAGDSYIQTNLINTNDGGTADIVVTANTGTDYTYFLDAGFANKDYQSGSEFNNIGNAVNRLDGYIYAQGSTSNTWGGNLIVGSTTTGKEIRFIAGGGSVSNVVARMNSSAIILNQQLVFADGTSQNTSVGTSASTYANGAFIQANSSFLQANTPSWVANSASLYANGAFIQANAAFIRANTPDAIANSSALYANGAFIQANAAYSSVNTALQNTSTITVNNNLIVPGTITTSNTTINNSIVTPSITANSIILNDGGLYQYTTSNNVTVTQLTDKTTSVTANGRTGQITTASSSVAKGTAVTFTVNNNQIVSAMDVPVISFQSGATTNSSAATVTRVQPGSFNITITNSGVGSLSDTIIINFAIIRVSN